MGVPKFYRWLSERYPCLSQIVQEQQIPEFDNLYLDMNGIIHPCSHPNDNDPHFRKKEEDVFEDIFHYIEVLFRIIKPKKVFFMAVDGVAPRAKMNQQRGRRFRSAREAEDSIRKALAKGQVLPKEERFDSNCITPGTSFMVRLHKQLKFFISYKISTDPAWQGLRIYLSGHETPGEGEHKIMEFIRFQKTRPDYDPNTRHCLYGLDADLIMLGLSSHEPHFSLLREEVRFGKAAKRTSKPEKTTFHLLHLSLLREYVDWEFSDLKEKLPFPYDLERVLDDWILMGFLVGNDFIPHLPNLHINHDALPYLYKVYLDVLPSLDGYLHDSGKLALLSFEKYLAALSKFDREKFEEKFVDMKWYESKIGCKGGGDTSGIQRDHRALENNFADEFCDSSSQEFKTEMNPELEKVAARFVKELGDFDENDDDTFEAEFVMSKRDYYMEKLGYQDINENVMKEQTVQYVTGIQWILLYYFCGVPSWSWFYPFHYAPYISDIMNFSDVNIAFDLGAPFLPFEQLLAVLPAASRQLLPQPFQNLMVMEQSPIIEYYPVNFKTDLNGKQHDWEAVVLIPFIDEVRLLDAMKPLYVRLSDEEIARNGHGPCLLYTYKHTLNFTYPSSLPGKFPDISCCHALCEELFRDAFHVDVKEICKGLADGVKLDVYYPGFPTLYHIPHKATLKKANVKVFQMHSRSNSMILTILGPQEKVVPERLAEDWLGETCYVGWPHMVEALVVGVCNGICRYSLQKVSPQNTTTEISRELLTTVEVDSWKHQVSTMTENHLERRGIELGDTTILIEACPIRGRRFVCGVKGLVTMEKEWSPMPSSFPYQLTVKDIHVHETCEEQSVHSIEELFPVGSVCFMLASPYYGASGEVVDVDVKQSRVRVQLRVPPEPDISSVIDQHHSLSLNYLPAHVLAKKLGVTPYLLSRITSSFLVKQGSSHKSSESGSNFDIGLKMKFSKQNKEVLGYARRTDEGGWTFSPTARKTIAEYLQRFPELFESLAKTSSTGQLYEDDLVTQDNGLVSLNEVQDWLKTVPAVNLEPVKCGSISLDEPVVEAIERVVEQTKAFKQKPKTVKVRVRPHLLFKPSEHRGTLLPDCDASFELFDRVVNIKSNATVPFGLRGTVIGIHEGDNSTDAVYEVVFDEAFLGGQPLRCSSNKVYLMEAASVINISYGERCENKKVDVKSPPRKEHYQGCSETNYKSPLRPDLGASPELRKNGFQTDKSGNIVSGPKVSQLGTEYSTEANHPLRTHVARSNSMNSAEKFFKSTRSKKGQLDLSCQQNEGLSEFTDVWKELKQRESFSPDKKEPDLEDIGKPCDNQEGKKSTSEREFKGRKIDRSARSFAEEGTQVLQELLQVGDKQVVKENTKVLDKHKPNEGKQQLRSFNGQDREIQQTGSASVQRFSTASPLYSSGSLPSVALLNWCCLVGLQPPSFHYSVTPQGVIAVVELSNGFKFPGGVCGDHGEAAESASSVALFQLPRIMPSFPHPMYMTTPRPFVELQQQQQQSLSGYSSRSVHQVSPPVCQHLSTLQRRYPDTSCTPARENTLQCRENLSAPPLNVTAAPFIPLQVARRSYERRQVSAVKDPGLASEVNISNSQEIEGVALSPAKNKLDDKEHCSLGESAIPQEAHQLSSQRVKTPIGPLRKAQSSRQRLLAPSFFTKK